MFRQRSWMFRQRSWMFHVITKSCSSTNPCHSLERDLFTKVFGITRGEFALGIIMRLSAVGFDGVGGGQGCDAPGARQVETAPQPMHEARAIGVARAGRVLDRFGAGNRDGRHLV